MDELLRPRGTEDILPDAAARWRRLEDACHAVCGRYGFGEIRTPLFERYEVFHRALGDQTDVVQKETYDFEDRAGRRMTLRPEGTAAVVRAVLQARLLGTGRPRPLRLYYVDYAAFRYERPQAGRQRQFHQFGCEVFGADSPAVDAEIVALAADVLDAVGLEGYTVCLNSIGDETCRPGYRAALRAYYAPLLPDLCGDCQRRFEQNPLRLLDCKVDAAVAAAAPRSLDHLCNACTDHFDALRHDLAALGVRAELRPQLVRGFDYYTRTVFEFVHGRLGAQNSVLGGGRYDGLVQAFGGPATPAAGFAMGMERLLELLGGGFGPAPEPRVYVAAADAGARTAVAVAAHALRRAGVDVLTDVLERGLGAQLKDADRGDARYCLILAGADGEAATLRDLRTGEQDALPVSAALARLGGELGR